MLTRYEDRRRSATQLYKVVSWYFLGILVFRSWELLTVPGHLTTPGER